MIADFARGVARIGRFSGREPPGRFWPYAFVVLILAMLAVGACVGVLARLGTGPQFAGLAVGLGVTLGAAVVLLAAAVTRRLHDRDESGLWGLMPLPFLILDVVGFPRAMSNLALGISDPWLLGGLFANNLVYLAALGALLALLARDGTPGPNRYGPAPNVWDFSPATR